jgi:hypothetical protein
MSESDSEEQSPQSNRKWEKAEEQIEDDIRSLQFDINKSLIYLTKRKSFFDSLHHLSIICTTLSSSVAFATLFADYQSLTKIIMFIVIMISMIDLSVGFSKKNDLYDSLQRRFTALLVSILTKDRTESNLIQWKIERLLIEQDEPPTLKVLEIICQNEQCIAEGYNNSVKEVPLFKALLRHFWSFDNWNPNK